MNEYERGKEVGRVSQRLDDHDKHFARINGDLADTAKALRFLGEQVSILRTERNDQDKVAAAAVAGADRGFSRKERIAALIISSAVLLLSASGFLINALG